MDWTRTPLENFLSILERQEDGTHVHKLNPFGDGEAQRLMGGLFAAVAAAYEKLLPADYECYENEGRVPVIRDGERGHEALAVLTLEDLPAILETLVVLEAEAAEEAEQWRKVRRRELDRERRKRKRLGEW